MADQTKKPTKKTTRTGTGLSAARKSVIKSRTKIMPSEEQIRARAFEVYLQRRGGPGDAASDWAQAERELTAEMSD